MKFEFDTTNLKRQAEENPLVAAGVFAAVLTACSKLLDSSTKRKYAKTWNSEVKRRNRK